MHLPAGGEKLHFKRKHLPGLVSHTWSGVGAFLNEEALPGQLSREQSTNREVAIDRAQGARVGRGQRADQAAMWQVWLSTGTSGAKG